MVDTLRSTKTQAPTVSVRRKGVNAKKCNQQEKRTNERGQITSSLGLQSRDEGFLQMRNWTLSKDR